MRGNWISIFSNSDLDLDHLHPGSNPKLRLNVSYSYTKFGVKRPKQTSYWVETEFLILVTVTLTLITDTWVAIPSCVLMLATHTASLVSIGQSKLKLLSRNQKLMHTRHFQHYNNPVFDENLVNFKWILTSLNIRSLTSSSQKPIINWFLFSLTQLSACRNAISGNRWPWRI